ncbi:MAG: hypothetical protein HKN85_06860 [Gammaproteobacteria bacterium]|nr:hypothetical protein [Gammaproteobacteria bacterium]
MFRAIVAGLAAHTRVAVWQYRTDRPKMLTKLPGLAVFIVLLSGFYGYAEDYPDINQARSLAFPRDNFAHSDLGTEWWYFNGFLGDSGVSQYAFHLAFFVRRTEIDFYKQILPILSFIVFLAYGLLARLANRDSLPTPSELDIWHAPTKKLS